MPAPIRRLPQPRWTARRRDLAQAALLFTALTAILFHRVLLFGETYCGTIDMYNQHYPITVGAFRTLLDGEFPLWCPWRGAGAPWFAATSPNLFDPFAVWYLLFPGDWGVNLQFMSQVFAAAMAYYVFLRYWRASHAAALVVAVMGVWTPIFLAEMPWRVLTGAHWALPLALVAFDRALRGPRPLLPVAAASILLALGLFGTQPQIWTYEILFVALYAAVWWWPRRSPATAARGLGLGLAVGLLFFCLTAVQVLPFVEFFSLSNRVAPVAGAQPTPEAILGDRTIEAGPSLATGARTVGRDAIAAVRAFAWDGWFYLTRGYRALRPYPGVQPSLTVLALLGLGIGWRREPVRWAALGLVLTAVGYSTLLGEALGNLISGFQLQRLNLFLPWMMGIPAAVGLDAARAAWGTRWPLRRVALPLIAGVAILVAWVDPTRRFVLFMQRSEAFAPHIVSYVVRVVLELLLLLVVVARLSGLRPMTARRFRIGVLALGIAVAATHALYGVVAPIRVSPLKARTELWSRYMTPATPDRLGLLVMQPDPRHYGEDIEEVLYQLPMHPNHAAIYTPPFAVVGDYNNLLVQTYLEYVDMMNLGERSRGWLNLVGIGNPGSPLLDLLGVRYVAGRLDVREAPGGERYRLVHADPAYPYRGSEDFVAPLPLFVNENVRRLPRAFFLNRAVVLPERASRLRALAAADFDARRGVILDAAPPPPARAVGALPPDSDPAFTAATVLDYRTNRVDVEVDAPAPGLLVLTDVAFPGWTATVDGVSADVLTAYHTFRAVAVEPGTHRVRFRYAPAPFAVGARISAVAWGLSLVVGGVGLAHWRRRGIQSGGAAAGPLKS